MEGTIHSRKEKNVGIYTKINDSSFISLIIPSKKHNKSNDSDKS